MFSPRILRLMIAAGLLATGGVRAESPVVAGDYSIYYSTVNAEALDPEIAALHGILRSRLSGLLNVTVVKRQADGRGQNVQARVEATARSGSGPVSYIPMREIRVGEGISYIGQFPIEDLQIVDFAIQVTPPGGAEPSAIELREQFFID